MKETKFETIPNEVLLEIFEYLSSYDIFQIFYFLNERYKQLLISLQLRIDLMNIRKKAFDYYSYFVFPFVPHRIISFRCEDIFDRLIYQIHLSDFISLKYLTIFNINNKHLQSIISQINKLQKLVYLNLQVRKDQTIDDKIIFKGELPLIEKCIMNLNKRIIFQDDHIYPNLKSLTINECAIEDLCLFLHTYTLQVRHLTVTLIDGKTSDQSNKIHELTSLIINTRTISFHRLTNSMFTLFPSLQQLSINATGIDYANGKSWQKILSTNFPRLVHFQLHIFFSQDDTPTTENRTQLLKTFETSYFSSHKWYFAFIHRPSIINIQLFSLPLIEKQLDFNLYDTHIETTMTDENMFVNINELALFLKSPHENPTSRNSSFRNVHSLKLISQFREYEPFPKSLFVDISHLVNFSHLKSIEFVGTHFPSTSLVLLDYTLNLHSLILPLDNLIKMTKVLTDSTVCQRLTRLIKHLTITSIYNVKNLLLFERLPIVFGHLDSLSLSVDNPNDLYILITLILSKMAPILKTMTISISTLFDSHILDQFMIWLIDYMHKRDVDLVDMKLTGDQLCFDF